MENAGVLYELAERWASVYGLRHVIATNSHRGIVDGVCVEVAIADQSLKALLFSPNASLINPIANDFASFQHTSGGGVPPSCLRGILNSRADELGSCVLELSIPQLMAIGPERFDQILTLVARDFADLGADAKKLECRLCQAPSPTKLVLYQDAYHVICDPCFENLEQRVMVNPQALTMRTVNWRRAVPAMLFWGLVLCVLWGFLQHPSIKLPAYLAAALPALGVFAYFRATVAAAGGNNGALTIAMCSMSFAWILIGNILGFGLMIAELKIQVPWTVIIRSYFEDYLPATWVEESFFFVGGLAGIYFALGAHKSKTQKEVLEQL